MDKMTIINRALSATGNGKLVNLNDGSDEANSVEIAFDRAIDYMMAFHEWPFSIKTAPLLRVGDAELPPFLHAMQMPPEVWHLRAVIDDVYGVTQQHRVINNKIQTLTDTGIKALFLIRPTNNSTWHPAAAEVLTLMCEAELYQGLNEDLVAADGKRDQAENMLTRAAGRVNQQDSPRPIFLSRTAIARRSRKTGSSGIVR
jgi:hypothetical protein